MKIKEKIGFKHECPHHLYYPTLVNFHSHHLRTHQPANHFYLHILLFFLISSHILFFFHNLISYYWPYQFGQYVPHTLPVNPTKPLANKNLKPPVTQPPTQNIIPPSFPQHRPLPNPGLTNGNSASFRIDSKAFFLAFDGDQTDSYFINELG